MSCGLTCAVALSSGLAVTPAAAQSANATSAANVIANAKAAPKAASAASAALLLVYRTARLPSGVLGAPYDRLVVQGGAPPYQLQLLGKPLPEGLAFTAQGHLLGTPKASGQFDFSLKAVDALGAETQQPYTLYIGTGKPSVAAPKPVVISGEALLNPPERSDMAYMRVWKLLPEHVKEVAKEEDDEEKSLVPNTDNGAGTAPAPAASAPAPKKPSRLARLTEPMLHIEYPSLAMFNAALAMHQRDLCRQIVSKLVASDGKAVAARVCVPGKNSNSDAADAVLQPDDALKPEEVYDTLLAPRIKTKLQIKARATHDFAQGKPFVLASPGCGCGPAQTENQVYAMLPFWQATGAAQNTDFSAFTRLGVLGLYMRENGDLVNTPHAHDQSSKGLRAAQRHNTQLDLVLYRNEWPRLLALEDAALEQTARRAVRQAMDHVDTPFTDNWTRVRRFLQPVLSEPKYLYDGITVHFDYTPSVLDAKTGATDMPAYRQFFRNFMLQLISEMRQRGRAYALNIVVPVGLINEPGSAYSVEELLDYMQRTQPLLAGSLLQMAKAEAKAGGSKVVTRVIVQLTDPTTDSKKQLRRLIDERPSLRGDVRTAFMDSLLLMFVFPQGDKPAPMTGLIGEQLDDDLTYAEWQFGGATMWSLPLIGMGAGDSVINFLMQNFRDQKEWWKNQGQFGKRLCAVVCPIRTAVRLGFEGLLLLGAVSIGFFFFNCKVREKGGRAYLLFLVLGGVITAAVGLSLLLCDPALSDLSAGNVPLMVTLALVLLALLYQAAHKPEPKP